MEGLDIAVLAKLVDWNDGYVGKVYDSLSREERYRVNRMYSGYVRAGIVFGEDVVKFFADRGVIVSSDGRGKRVVCYSGGELVGSYVSISDASRCSGVRKAGISACLRGVQRTAGGYEWRLDE